MFTTVIVGTDGSENAETAVRVVSEMAAATPGMAVHVVAAYHPWAAAQLRSIAMELPVDLRQSLRIDAVTTARLDRVRALFDGLDPEPSFHAVEKDPTDALLELAERHAADLIVVGSRGEGALRRAVHGSVATKIAHRAPCSVMVVKPGSYPC